MSSFFIFIAVGVLNTALGYSIIFGLMYGLGVSPVLSNVTGYLIGLMVSYALNRKFTFRSKARSKPEMIRFVIVFLIAYSANLLLLVSLIHVFSMNEGIAQVIAGIAYLFISYALNRSFVFVQGNRI